MDVHGEGCPWTKNVSEVAATKGYLDILKYVIENDYPYSKDICVIAAKNGHLDVLKYLHEEGFPLSWKVYKAAKNRFRNKACIQYLRDNGCPRSYVQQIFYNPKEMY